MSLRLTEAAGIPDLTRRQMLGGALATAGLAVVPLPLVVRAPNHAVPGPPLFGANSRAVAAIDSVLNAKVHGERCYAPPHTGKLGVPGRWFRSNRGVYRVIGSFKPNVDAVLSGKLDAELHALAHQIPAPHIVTAWHEGEEPNSGSGFTAKRLQAFHAHVAPIFRKAGKRYVQIMGSYSIHTRGKDLHNWVSPHVDAVYIDGYQRYHGITPEDIFGPMEAAITQGVGKQMPRGITETNSAFRDKRPEWFAGAWAYAVRNHHQIFLTFWNADFQWYANDHATIRELHKIFATA